MKTKRFLIVAALPAMLIAVGALAATDSTNRVQRCIQVREGTRGYPAKTMVKCEVDLRQLKIVDDFGVKSPAPVGGFKVEGENKTINVGPGGFILK